MDASELSATLSEYVATLSDQSEHMFWKGARWAAERAADFSRVPFNTEIEHDDDIF